MSPNELAARASPTAPRRSDLPKLDTNLMAMQNQVGCRFHLVMGTTMLISLYIVLNIHSSVKICHQNTQQQDTMNNLNN